MRRILSLYVMCLSVVALMAQQWTGTWATATETPFAKNDVPQTLSLEGNTLRQVVRVSLGGDVLRLELSNVFGDEPLEVKSVYIADAAEGEQIDAKTTRYLTFNGSRNVSIHPRQVVFSDALKYRLKPLQRLSVTIHYGSMPKTLTTHRGSRTTSYIMQGECKPKDAFRAGEKLEHWYTIASLDVQTDGTVPCIAVLGNSITDGRGSTTDAQNRWTDVLAEQLQGRVGVLNLGIGGNCVLQGGLGQPAVDRFDRDILAQRGVKTLVIFEGINDIGGSKQVERTGRQLIRTYEQFTQKAHQAGMKVYLGTITPLGNTGYWSHYHEACRQTVNEWIRNNKDVDGLLDFDQLISDSQQPTRIRAEWQYDWLHPNAEGYRQMGNYAATILKKQLNKYNNIAMKLKDILNGPLQAAEWERKGYVLPKFDILAVREKTRKEPTWVHFGGGNIFRAFPAAMLNDALNTGNYDRGVIVAETFDYEVVDKAYTPYDNLSLLVSLKGDGTVEKKVIASVTEALKADYQFADWQRLCDIFRTPTLQMISFTITEKGYSYNEADLSRGLQPVFALGKVTALLYERWQAGVYPLTIQSMDNCSHNGDKVKAGVMAYAERWLQDGLVPKAFVSYLKDERSITFPWSMIDKITPRPHEKVKELLAKDGFEDNDYIETEKHTFTAPFVNAEETQYLVIEDDYTNGRPPLDLGGALYTTRETVDKVETMKVTTCLNPLHTAMSIYGCMLGYTLISAEMQDADLRPFIQKIGYIEAMPVVTDPGVLNPYEFIGAVINKRLPNPFMPDAPQRIAMDTSQKLPIRFGETIKKYIARGLDMENLVLIPLVLAGYARYLKGVKDDGTPFDPSPDPMLSELQAIVAPLEVGKADQDYSCLKQLYSRKDVFGLDLYEAGLGEQIEGMVCELFAGPGAVRQTLHRYVAAR